MWLQYLFPVLLGGSANANRKEVADDLRCRRVIGMSQACLRRFGKYVRFRWGSPELEVWAGHPELKGCEFVDPVTCKAKVIRDEW